MADRLVAVFDCGVFLQGLMSKTGPAAECLELVDEGRVRLVMSEAIVAELVDVLNRPEIRRLSPLLTDEKIAGLVQLIYEKSEFVEVVPPHFSFTRDPSDEPYLNLAIETNAAVLVARDRDLLDLMTDSTDQAKEFRQRFRNLKIVSPKIFSPFLDELNWH